MESDEARRKVRWKEEGAFFDRWADATAKDISGIDPLVVARYERSRLRLRFSKEFRLRLLGDLTSKSVLDVGCGEGENAIILAKAGATVTGVDVSPKAIQVATTRARLSGVARTVKLVNSPLEIADFPPSSFDVIWGDAILHHLIPELGNVLKKLNEWARPGALMVFGEPVNFNQTLRRLRFMVPVHTDTTPGERPLEAAEVRLIRNYIPDLTVRVFSLFGRLNRFILPNMSLERASVARRSAAELLALSDYALLSIPGIKRLGGSAALFGHPSK